MLACPWMHGFMTRPDMSIKAGCQSRDMRIAGRIAGVRSTEQSVGIMKSYLHKSYFENIVYL